MKHPCIYILLCANGHYYTGSTTNLEHRLHQHEHGDVGGFTEKLRPFTLVFAQEFPTIKEALAAEKQVKGWTRAKKEALMRGDFNALHNLARCRNVTTYTNKPTD